MQPSHRPTRYLSSTGGVTVATHDLGGDGPPTLLAHATGFCGTVWRPFAAALPQRWCVAPDLRGHGQTSLPAGEPLTWDGFADDILAVVDGLGLDRPIGVGHSKGGAALLRAEIRRPGTFAALWCFEPIVFPGPSIRNEANPLAEGALRRRALFSSREEAYANFANKPPMAAFDPDALAGYIEGGFVDDPPATDTRPGSVTLACRPEVEAEIYRTGSAHDTFERLAAVSCPVVVACGGDGGYPAQLAPLVAEELPDGHLHRFEHVGHFGPLEAPAELAADVATLS
ncbi:MAG: alpha/beta hydrolase [Acidimicrobiia bacterium]|nr:alpha/beta hydrolase [Acidimicrobiia bacterium]